MAESVCALEWVGEGERCKSGGEAARGLGRPRIRPRDAQSLRACSKVANSASSRSPARLPSLRPVSWLSSIRCVSSACERGRLASRDKSLPRLGHPWRSVLLSHCDHPRTTGISLPCALSQHQACRSAQGTKACNAHADADRALQLATLCAHVHEEGSSVPASRPRTSRPPPARHARESARKEQRTRDGASEFRAVVGARGNVLDLAHDEHRVLSDDLAKDDVLVVEERRRVARDEELAPVRVWA